MKLLLVFLVLVAALPVTASAAPQTFVNGGLKFESVVNLDVVGDDARGAFLVSEYDRDHASRFPFTGKVVPTPKGKTGVWLEIQFDPKSLKDNATPYAIPEGAKRILWTLRISLGATVT